MSKEKKNINYFNVDLTKKNSLIERANSNFGELNTLEEGLESVKKEIFFQKQSKKKVSNKIINFEDIKKKFI